MQDIFPQNPKHLYMKINHTYTKKVKSLTYTIIFNLIWHILHNLLVEKNEEVKNNFIHINIDCVHHPTVISRKACYIIISKDFIDPSFHSIS